VRRAAAAEMARVLKPGGICILTDSSQLGDREAFDATLA
jgi:ubiquinone/menaquinone biosynthesis C-methylase UbiE